MVKPIPPVFYEDKDMLFIQKVKSKHGGNWHDFLLDCIRSLDCKFEEDGIKGIEKFGDEE